MALNLLELCSDVLCHNNILIQKILFLKTIQKFTFYRYGLPNFAYGVDGSHIALRNAPSPNELPPGLGPQDFWCRKQVSVTKL